MVTGHESAAAIGTQGDEPRLEVRRIKEGDVAAAERALRAAEGWLDAQSLAVSVSLQGAFAKLGTHSYGVIDLALRSADLDNPIPADRLATYAAALTGETGPLSPEEVSVRVHDAVAPDAGWPVAKRHGAVTRAVYDAVKREYWRSRGRPGPLWREPTRPVLKILLPAQWRELRGGAPWLGSPLDKRDGFIHLSAPEQLEGTLKAHFSDMERVWLVTCEASALGDALRWEPSRDGQLFPHLYRPLALSDVYLVRPRWLS